MTTSTTGAFEQLKKCGEDLLNTALEYHRLANINGISGAVIWLTGVDGEMVIVTRGEYKETLLRNIEYRGPSKSFGHSLEDEV